jgi:hypothetical protein
MAQCMNRSCGHTYVVLTSKAHRQNFFCSMTCEQDAINNALQAYIFIVAKKRQKSEVKTMAATANSYNP